MDKPAILMGTCVYCNLVANSGSIIIIYSTQNIIAHAN